jgi:GTP-binding protein
MPARFILSAVKPEQFPPEGEPPRVIPEVAFLGRSNVGKSSLINALVSADGLAYTSSRPGCTQAINFFELDDGFRFVDLPGYGFAKVPKQITQEWKALIESYLLGRGALRLAVIVLDARRGWMERDLELQQWLEAHGRPYLVVATKVDKLKTQKEKHDSRKSLRAVLSREGHAAEILECSATTGRGVREIWQAISKIKNSQ